jgi:hypothetical protein
MLSNNRQYQVTQSDTNALVTTYRPYLPDAE